MFKKTFAVFILFVLIVAALPVAVAADEQATKLDFGFDLELTADSVYFMNLDSGMKICGKNEDKRVHPASTTKIMTAALVMTMCTDLDNTIVTVPAGVWNEFEGDYVSNAGLKVGEELTMNELLHCLLIQSANEAAVTIAEYYGYDTFIKMMNEKAQELGCQNTNFANPHGYFGDHHYTTAEDLAIITQWALTIPGFWEITQLATYEKAATNMNEATTLVTTNDMQNPSSRYYNSYIKGIKTGRLSIAGKCLVSAAQKNGVTYLLVIMGAPEENVDTVWEDGWSSYTDTKRCYDWAFENLELLNAVDNTTAVDEIKIRYAARRDTVLLYPAEDVLVVDRVDSTENNTRYEVIDKPESINAPLEAGEVVCRAEVYYDYGYGEVLVGEVDLVSRESIELNAFSMIMDAMTEILTSTAAKIIYIILVAVIILYLYYVKVVVPKARKKQRKLLEEKRRRQEAAKHRGTHIR